MSMPDVCVLPQALRQLLLPALQPAQALVIRRAASGPQAAAGGTKGGHGMVKQGAARHGKVYEHGRRPRGGGSKAEYALPRSTHLQNMQRWITDATGAWFSVNEEQL